MLWVARSMTLDIALALLTIETVGSDLRRADVDAGDCWSPCGGLLGWCVLRTSRCRCTLATLMSSSTGGIYTNGDSAIEGSMTYSGADYR